MTVQLAHTDRAWMPAFVQSSIWASGPEFDHGYNASLPPGFPGQVETSMTWAGASYQDKPERYAFKLSTADINEVEAAVECFQALRISLDKISKDSFCLPTLGPRLQREAQEIHNGRGFFVIQGLDPRRYTDWTNSVIYVGLSSYIGERRGRQDEFGNMLLHLTDLGSSAAPDTQRQAPYSSVSQPFHTDTGSILGLYCLGKASVGGESKLVSTAHIYNKIAKIRPDFIRILAKDDWVFDRFGQNPPFSTRPILHQKDGKFIFSFSRRPLLGSPTSPRTSSIPSLSQAQTEALNLVQSIAEESSVVFNLEPGDCLFWNNLGLLHSRNGFTDSATEKRHLVRLWIHSDEHTWSIPDPIRKTWEAAYGDEGPGPLWPLKPITDREYISTQQRSSGHS